MSEELRPKIALWFRYGPAEHTELFHAIPRVIELLSEHAEVNYFGMKTSAPVPQSIHDHAVVHLLPFKVNRRSGVDKAFKTFLWLLSIPWMARRCNKLGIDIVYIDETVPLSGWLARKFFHGRLAMTVADFFVDIYFEQKRWLQPLANWIRRKDIESWRRLDLIFTRAASTRDYLVELKCDADRIFPVHDPCDFSLYHPMQPKPDRKRFGLEDSDLVLVHHGILHPNKGNDRIIQALSELRESLPNLRYLLVGDGPDMAHLKELVKDLKMEDVVVFTGWLPQPSDVNLALNTADIGLVMRTGQLSDNFHTTGALVHSMACGLPVLAANLGGVASVMNQARIGLLFDPDDMETFNTALSEMANDEELRMQMGRAAHELAEKLFDMELVSNDTVSPLLQLMEKR